MLSPHAILSFFTLFIRSMVLLIVYSEYTKGDNTLAKYFAKWYLAGKYLIPLAKSECHELYH